MKINYKISTIILSLLLLISSFFNITNMMHKSHDSMDVGMNDMNKMLDNKTGHELEKEFIINMIPHHQGAVNMAQKVLSDPNISPAISAFAQQIISAQESEIIMMKDWLNNK